MRSAQSIACLLLIAGTLSVGQAVPEPAYAQAADPDDDDDAEAGDDDDADVPDPDDPAGGSVDADSGGGDAGDPGGDPSDSGEPVDAGGDDAGADPPDAEVGSGAGDDGAATDDGADDDGAAPAVTGGDDDSADDDGAAPAVTGGDDDGADDDDGAGSAATVSTAAGDDDDDDDDDDQPGPISAAVSRDDDDSAGSVADADDDGGTDDEISSGGGAGEDGPVEFIGGGEESEAERLALDEKDGIETDREGFRYRRSEFVAVDLDARDIVALRGRGFSIAQSEQLASAGTTVHLIKGPPQMTDQDAYDLIDDLADPESLGLNHLFDSSSGEVRKRATRPAQARTACGCQIGMIDTGIAARLPLFRHVAIEQRAFNAKVPTPRMHGTAVAHQFAGSVPRPGRATRIVIADIFSGQRGSAGSTFALVRALDWLASRNIPVINVSLAGPRNPAVAGTVQRLTNRGHVIVAAAGNDGPAAPPVFPGADAGVVAVTAVDDRQQVYRYANRGAYIDFAASGVNVPAINPAGEQTVATGTSFAAPAVAARLARELAKPSPAESTRLLARLEREARDLGTPGRDSVFGHGLIEDQR